MFDSLWQDVKYKVQTGNMVTRLVVINVVVFLAINIIYLLIKSFGAPNEVASIYHNFLKWISLSSDGLYTLTHIWVIITHMFVHEKFLHILFNMLYIYWFGNILGDMIGDKKILPIYLLGGLMGALVYLIAAQFMQLGGIAMGASAAGLAIVVASAMVAPEYNMRLMFLGDVKLKWIAVALVVIDVMFISFSSDNTGGHIAHLGGAFMGYLFISSLNRGTDLSEPVNNFFDKVQGFFKPKKLKVVYKNTSSKRPTLNRNQRAHAVSDNTVSDQDQLDAILDKIKLKGYDSLSSSEKKFLTDASKK